MDFCGSTSTRTTTRDWTGFEEYSMFNATTVRCLCHLFIYVYLHEVEHTKGQDFKDVDRIRKELFNHVTTNLRNDC